MEVKALNFLQKDIAEYDDFFLSCEVFIGPNEEQFTYEVYSFNVISIKRLYNTFEDNGIMMNKGWMIMKYYDEVVIEEELKRIVEKCNKEKAKDFWINIGTYLRKQDSDGSI